MFWKKEDTPKITFRRREDHVDAFPDPIPASKAMPDWFKKLNRVPEGNSKYDGGTVKRCVPVLDAITNGYVLPLWADMTVTVKVQQDDEGREGLGVWCQFPNDFGLGDMIGTHGWQQVGDDCPIQKYPVGKALMKFVNPWVIETAPGYSVLFKSPPHQYSDIHILEGVVDTDTYQRQVNFPFIWTGTQVGEWFFPKGTPWIHVVPFKRDKLEMEIAEWDHTKMTAMDRAHDTHFFDKYKKLWWHKRK